jgi:chromosome segregation ATPase
MTDEDKRQLKIFDGKIRQLISNYQVMKKEIGDLYIEVDRKDEEIARLKAELRQSQSDYSNLKLAKMIEISDSELKGAKQRISKLVREVNKCIGLLSTDLNQG